MIPDVKAWKVLQHVTCKDIKGWDYVTRETVDITRRFSVSDQRVYSFCWFDVADIPRSTTLRGTTTWYDPDGNAYVKQDYEMMYGSTSWKAWAYIEIKGQGQKLKKGKWAVDFALDGGPLKNEVLFKDSFTIGITVLKIRLAGVPSSASANIVIDNKPFGTVPGSLEEPLEVVEGEEHTITVDEYVSGTTGTRYRCSTNTIVLRAGGSLDESRQFSYATEYKLTVDSPYGNPTGDGWYGASFAASFSVTSPVPLEGFLGMLGGKRVFEKWTGDSSSVSPSSSIAMDSPKTVTAVWRADYTTPIMILSVLSGASGIGFAAFSRRRKKAAPPAAPAGVVYPEPAPASLPSKPVPETTPAVKEIKEVKEVSAAKAIPVADVTVSLDDRVYNYIVEHGGEIALSQAAKDLGISLGELRAAIDRLISQRRLA